MGWVAYSYMGPLLLSIPSKRFERDGWPIPTWGLLLLSTLSKNKKSQGYERVGWVASSYVGPYTSFLLLRKSLRGMGGQLLHVAFYSFLIPCLANLTMPRSTIHQRC